MLEALCWSGLNQQHISGAPSMNQKSAIGFLTNYDLKSAVVNVDIPATKFRRK